MQCIKKVPNNKMCNIYSDEIIFALQKHFQGQYIFDDLRFYKEHIVKRVYKDNVGTNRYTKSWKNFWQNK